jgi:hypothetical protein
MPDIVVAFFFLGLIAGLLKSDLEIPQAAYDTLSLLLMLTIGLKGGLALHGNLSWALLPEMVAVVLLGAVIPLVLFPLLRRMARLSVANSASIAAHYGSVSAGTFAVALAYVESQQLVAGPETTLYLVMMELPAIVVGLMLYRHFQAGAQVVSLRALSRETLTNRGVVLLLGGLVIGWMYGPREGSAVTDLYTSAFKGVLALFLLEMGLTAANTLRPFPSGQWRLILFALLAPPCLALVGIAIGAALGLPEGSRVILATLTASASYIAAPVAIRHNVPEADIGLAMLVSLGVTFPFNVLIGIGLYHHVIQLL